MNTTKVILTFLLTPETPRNKTLHSSRLLLSLGGLQVADFKTYSKHLTYNLRARCLKRLTSSFQTNAKILLRTKTLQLVGI